MWFNVLSYDGDDSYFPVIFISFSFTIMERRSSFRLQTFLVLRMLRFRGRLTNPILSERKRAFGLQGASEDGHAARESFQFCEALGDSGRLVYSDPRCSGAPRQGWVEGQAEEVEGAVRSSFE